MPREFKTIEINDMDDVIVNTFKANEMDLHVHLINKDRYERMLLAIAPETPFRARIQKLLNETNERIVEVSSILDATEIQLPTQERLASSISRIKAKEESSVKGV